MRNFFRVVLLIKSLIAVGGFGWVVGMNFSAARSTGSAEAGAVVHNAAYAIESFGTEQK